MKLETRYCDECVWFEPSTPCRGTYYCLVGHKPRFYKPRNPLDDNWGYKKKCKDYIEV